VREGKTVAADGCDAHGLTKRLVLADSSGQLEKEASRTRGSVGKKRAAARGSLRFLASQKRLLGMTSKLTDYAAAAKPASELPPV
jgi:hypothetical protein